MGHITINELSEELKNQINSSGMKEEDVNNLIQSKIGTNELSTTNKTITGAINELFQSVDSGKQLIADAIDDESITKDSTFAAMGEAIIEIKESAANPIPTDTNRLYGLMYAKEYDVTSDMNIDELMKQLEFLNLNSDVKQVACSYNSTFILKTDGTLWGCGYNSESILGIDNLYQYTFAQIENNVDKVFTGNCSNHIFILKTDGTLWGCGNNTKKQLGLGSDSTNYVTRFTQVDISDVKEVSCGMYHTVLLKNDGTVWSCGYNNYGQLGTRDTKDKNTFTQVQVNATNTVQISCGGYHTYLLKSDGTIWSTGSGDYGQQGFGNNYSTSEFTKNKYGVANVKKISSGENHIVVLKNDGTIWSVGRNNYGQLGLNSTSDANLFTKESRWGYTDVIDVTCGGIFTMIIRSNGLIAGAGHASYGELGRDTSNTYLEIFNTTPQTITDVKEIICGRSHTMILKHDGELLACGYNYYGQLGLGTTSDKKEFVQSYRPEPVDPDTLTTEELYTMKLYVFLLEYGFDVKEDMTLSELFNIIPVNITPDHGSMEINRLKLYSVLKDAGYDVDFSDSLDDLFNSI